MGFNRSLAQRIRYRPWRWTDETETTKQELNGVFILLSDELVEMLANSDELTDTQKQQLRDMAHRVTVEEAGEWHVPVWAGQDKATYLRIPATHWNDPTSAPPAAVKKFFRRIWNEVSQ